MIEVAKTHTIDAADPRILVALNGERVNALAEKHRLTVDEIKAGARRGNVICADEYEIGNISSTEIGLNTSMTSAAKKSISDASEDGGRAH